MDEDDARSDEAVDEAESRESSQGKRMAPALISIHPLGSSVVVCIGAGFRVFDFEMPAASFPSDAEAPHRAAVRAARFDSRGKYFVTAGDDKLVKLWDTQTWKCLKTIVCNKKTSAVAFTLDSQWLLAADKFGVVFVLPFLREGDLQEPVQLLAHCCSIITSLETSPCGKFIVTADRDFKIRTSVLPKNPPSGAHEIHSFCLGHRSFVSCVAFVHDETSPQSLLVSGGGDSTIRLWNYDSGSLLDTMEIPLSEGAQLTVVGLATSSTLVAVIVESFPGVLLLNCDLATKKLFFTQKIELQGQICPTDLQFDSKDRLWLVAGAGETREVGDRALTTEQIAQLTLDAQTSSKSALAWIRVLQRTDGTHFTMLEDDKVPGGIPLLAAVQGHEAEAYVPSATEAAGLAMKNLMSKRQYSQTSREIRKRNRNDRKINAKLNKRVEEAKTAED